MFHCVMFISGELLMSRIVEFLILESVKSRRDCSFDAKKALIQAILRTEFCF